MVIVNFKIVMGAEQAGPHWLLELAGLFDGRAAALFVVLAGAGISLMTREGRVNGDRQLAKRNRMVLWKRALFLFVVGLLYTPLWPADILHFYGIYIAIGALLVTAQNRWLWSLVLFFTLVFVLLILTFDYEKGWNWETLSYSGLWTFAGMIRNLFFNGFHPVFPWVAFLLTGMWLGRQDMSSSMNRKKLFLYGLGVAVLAESISLLLVRHFSNIRSELDQETLIALFGTKPMPPMSS